MKALIVEGVPYHTYRATWREKGKRRQRTILSPGHPWLDSEVRRMLEALDVPSGTTVRVEAK